VEFGILGPLRVAGRDGLIRVPGGRQGELLALLVIGAGRSVPAERLVDQLWGEDLPANPANALQQHVFGLRRLLDPAARGDVLLTRDGGYQLAVPDDAVDARRFEQLLRSGSAAAASGAPHEAVTILGEALALWRGDALQGLDRPWARTEAQRLEELRLVATEERIAADLVLGRHAGMVPELETLVAAHPLRERLRGQLMVALAGSGRQADALQVYTDTRELLAEELGVDPSRQLQAIHADVLAQRIVGPAGDRTAGPATAPSASDTDEVAAAPIAAQGSASQDVAVSRPGAPRPLPVPPGRFLGRDEELERLTRLLEDERLLTLTGPGGAGKTRLAIELARGLRSGSAHREVHLVELTPVTDPDAVASTVAAALGVADHRGLRATDAVLAAFEERQALVVLDNVEQVVGAVAAFAEQVVAACPQVQLLVTSREPLGVAGELVWPVPPLAVPPATTASGQPLSASEVERHAAVQLFLDRVRAVAPDLEVSASDLGGVARIVRDLDGLPLAIELAAARARVLSVPEIADRLHDRLGLLAGGRRTGPARHRTLRATLDWSYEPLTDAERRAFEAAAVPVAPFTTELLAPLLEAAGCDLDVLEAVTMLCDRSLLAVHERGTPSRYRMLETLREFAVAKLSERGGEPAVRDAHAEAVEAAVLAADRTTIERWAADIDEQRRWLPEARAALRWRLDRGHRRGVQRLAAGLGWLWLLAAMAPEGLRWLTAGLGPIGSIDVEDVEPGAVVWAGFLRLNEAPEDDGLRWAQLAAEAATDPVLRAMAGALVWIYRSMEDGHAAVATADAEVAAPSGEAGWAEGLGWLGRAQMLALTGDAARGSRALADAERLLVDNGAWFGIWANVALAYLQQLRGDRAAVERVVERGLAASEQRDLPELAIELGCTWAMVQAAGGELEAAERELTAAAAHAARTGVAMSRALVATTRGYLVWSRGEARTAIDHLESALELHDRLGNHFGEPFVRWLLGCCLLDDGEVVAAAEAHHAAYRSAQERGEGDVVAAALEGLAAVCVALAGDDRGTSAGPAPGSSAGVGAEVAIQGRRLAVELHAVARQRRDELRITAPLLTRSVIERVEDALSSRAAIADDLLADDLPAEALPDRQPAASEVELDDLVQTAVRVVRSCGDAASSGQPPNR